MMTEWKEYTDDNKNRLEVLEGKLNILLTLQGGQFVAFIAIIITLLAKI